MKPLPIIRPTLPDFEAIHALIRDGWASGSVTVGQIVGRFEQAVCDLVGTRYAIAVSSCTAGLMLVPRAYGFPLGGEVLLPSFTFAATAQAVAWNGLTPVFCDCLPGTCTLDPEDVARNLSPRSVAICPVSVYGLPPDVDAMVEIGNRKGLPVYFDSAQAMGATYRGRPVGGFGGCEVFSFSPTKVVTAVEGGVITTNDAELAGRFRSMRDYGKSPQGGEEMTLLGLSARMSELHAGVGLLSIGKIDQLINARLKRIEVYRHRLGKLPGCWVQTFQPDRTTSGNYFVLFITPQARCSRDDVYESLKKAGIQTKRYFYPPVHEHEMFRHVPMRVSTRLAQTAKCSREGLALPLYSTMTDEEQERVCNHVEALLS